MKWIIRVIVALLAFLVGVGSSQLRSLRERNAVETRTIRVIKFANQPATPLSAEQWRKVVVKDRFSFYIPANLNDDGHSADRDMAVGAFRKPNYDTSGLFYIYYVSHQQAEEDPTKRPDRYKATTRADVTIDGKRGHLLIEFPASVEILSIKEVPRVKVYFSDIGEGRKLYMEFVAGFGGEGIPVAQRVIDSIKFADALPPSRI